MSIAPVVIRSRSTPFLSIACLVLVAYFLVKASFFGGETGVFSLILGAVLAIVGLWTLVRSRSSSVIIDGAQFVVSRRRRTSTYRRSDVTEVDLSGFGRHLTLADGSGVHLPLEGPELVQAGLLLSPRRKGPNRLRASR